MEKVRCISENFPINFYIYSSFLFLEDCVWSPWSSWSPCDCKSWKMKSNPQLLQYKNVFQSRKRSIIEDNLPSFGNGNGSCVHLGNRETRKCKNDEMVLKCLPNIKNIPKNVFKVTKQGKGVNEEKEKSSKVMKALLSLTNKIFKPGN